MEVFEQNNTFTRAYRKNDRRLSVDEIRAEAHKRQKEIRDAARAAEMAEEEVALEKPKELVEKEAARKAATGQAGKAKRASEETARKAATGQAGKVKPVSEEAKRWAATGQADKDKQAGEETKRWATTGQAGKDKPAAREAARKAATGQAGKAKRVSEEAAQPRRATALRATARRANRAAQIAPRDSSRAIRAAQPRLHTAPIL
jgi:hypothetical protein